MTSRSWSGLVCLWVLAIASTLAEPSSARQVEDHGTDAVLRQRRSLLAGTQQISQCEWISGEGCALHPAYVSYALNHTNGDAVAAYVGNSLSCASVVDKGACDGISYCSWDPSFSNGQQGCFLHESALLAVQLQCVRPESRDSLSKLQSCMAARHSCQCSSNGDGSSACQLRQQQVLGSYSSGSNKVCQSLLGCWLSSLNGSSTDIMQLVEVQLTLVQPKLERLSSSSSNGGRRRVLQVLPALNAPITNDNSPSSTPSPAVSTVPEGYTFESGQYSEDGISLPSPSPAASSTTTPSVGMNGGIAGDDTAASPATGSPVENPAGIPAAVNPGSQSPSGSQGNPVYESGETSTGDWSMQGGSSGSTGNGSNTGGSSGSSGGSTAPSNSSNSSPDSSGVQMTGGNAPSTFWKCAGLAAVKADTTRKWADIDYNSKSLTLTTWIKVIQPTALIDWGVEVMECFKAEVNTLSANDANDITKPNKESMEYAIVALIRCFAAEADAFRTYLQADTGTQVAAGLASLQRLIKQIFPDQLKALLTKYNSATAYDRDIMLQAAALVADMQWFITDAQALASAASSAAQQQQVFEGVVSYGEEMLRKCLYWIFNVQFGGPPAHLPGVPTSTRTSTAVMDAFDGLAAAAFPAATVAADAPAWQQLQSMTAVAAGWASSAAAVMKAAGKSVDAAAQLGNTVDGLAKSHVYDFWGSRVELARAGAADAARQLALADPSQSAAAWQGVRQKQVSLLTSLQQQTAAASDASTQQVGKSIRDLVAASGAFLQSSSAGDADAQQQKLQDALKYSAYLAFLIRQCHGSPLGLDMLGSTAAAAVGVPVTAAAACTQLSAAVNQMAAAALAGSGDTLVQSLTADLNRQFVCNGQDTSSCLSTSGCKLALVGTLTPGAATGSSSSSSSATAELLMQADAASDLQIVCQADDAGLQLSTWSNSTKSQLATGSQCEQFLQLPDCNSMTAASPCSNYAACSWELTSERNLLHTVTGTASGSKSKTTGSSGVCSYNWAHLLRSSGAYSSVSNMVSQCSSISDQPQCNAQVLVLTLSDASAGPSNPVRYLVPALVAAVLLGLVLFGAAIWYRRKTSAARRAAEERPGAVGGGRGKKQKGAKGGKANKQQLKSKVKRAEPGSYKPDLMRDSFTDYMREAPAVAAGVAVAKAAQEAGLQNAAAVTLAQGDVSGARLYQQPADDQQQRGAGPVGLFASPVSTGRLPAGAPQPASASDNLIDIDPQSDTLMTGARHTAVAVQQPMPPPLPYVNSLAYPMNSHPVWGAAAAAAGNRLSGLGGGLGSAGMGGSGLLSGGLTEVDSLALTSSLGLVSSVPQPHGSTALGDPQQLALASQATMQQQLGLLYPSQQGRRSSRGLSAMDPAYSANSGSLLLGGHPSGEQADQDDFRDVEEGASTPTSSCHDSVFSRTTSARMGPPGAPPASVASGGSWRGRAGAGAPGLNPALSGALSGALSRSSWSSAMSTDQLMSSQPSAQL